MKTARITGIIIIILIMGTVVTLKMTVLREDTSALTLISEEYLARALSKDVTEYQKEKIRAKTARERTESLEEEYEQAEIENAMQFIPWKVSFKKTAYILLLCVGIVGFLGFMGFIGLGKLRRSSIVTQQIGEHSTLQVHYDLVKRPEMGAILAGLVNVEQTKAVNPEKALEYGERLLHHFEILAKGHSTPAQNMLPAAGAMGPEMMDTPISNVPTFADLLKRGMIAPGKPLLIGYTQDGQPYHSTLEDNYSTVVIGQSGTGKTTGEAYAIASTILAYGAYYTILDPHYPDRKKESLGDRLGALKGLEHVRIFNNPMLLDEVVDQLDNEFEQYKQTGQGRTPHIIVVDEHALWKNSSNGGKELLKFEEKIIYEGRKYGWYLHVTSKSPLAQDFGTSAVRDNFVTSFIYKVRKRQAQTYFADTELVELVQSCNKPGMAVYTGRDDISQVLQIPNISEQDMNTVVEMITVHQANGQEIVIENRNKFVTDKPAETSEKPNGVIDFHAVRTAKAAKKPVDQAEQKEPGETDLVTELNQRCEARPEGMSKNQWIKAASEQIGYSDSYLKNILLGNTKLTPESMEKINQWIKTM